jgi:hypothetical protein
MTHWLNAIFSWINRQNAVLIIFIMVMANYFGVALEGGEEQYLAFAKQYMDPMWMPNSFTLNHPAGGNLVFQVIVGYLLKFLTFEQTMIIGRTLNFLLFSFPLALIFRRLRISNIEMMFLLQVVFFGHQSLYAGEWIFKNFEEKSLAYIFVFWSLLYLLKEKPVISALFAVPATYFHFLVGGWMFCFVFIFFLVQKRKILPAMLSGALYALLMAPFILYLYKVYFTGNPEIINGVNTNAVYAFWRLKHHIGIFHDAGFFFRHAFIGVLVSLIMFGLCLSIFRKFKNPLIRSLNTLNIIIFSQQVIFMVIAIADKQGTLMKTYPFRTNTLSVFVFLLELSLIGKFYLANKVYRQAALKYLAEKTHPIRKMIFSNGLNALLMICFIIGFTIETNRTICEFRHDPDLDPAMKTLIGYVRDNTPGSAVFLFLDDDLPLSFIRRAEREQFVVIKFTPTRSTAIYEWYTRAMIKDKLQDNIELIDSVSTAYQVDYMVSDSAYQHPMLEVEKQFGDHYLFRIKGKE